MKLPDNELLALFAKQFSWSDGLGTAEISDLRVALSDITRRVWSDAADQGFLVAGRTGMKLFTLESVDTREGDAMGWRFVSQDGQQRILVIND